MGRDEELEGEKSCQVGMLECTLKGFESVKLRSGVACEVSELDVVDRGRKETSVKVENVKTFLTRPSLQRREIRKGRKVSVH